MDKENTIEEQQLIMQTKAGNTDCFSQLVLMHQDRLYQYLLARCHNSHDANDVLQESFINAYKYLDSYNSNWEFKTWLFTIASRLIKKQNILYPQNIEPRFTEESNELKEIVINKNNLWNKIRYIIKKEAFDVLWFYYVEEHTMKEIAQIVSKSQSWVKVTLFRAKKKLAKNQDILELTKHYQLTGIIL